MIAFQAADIGDFDRRRNVECEGRKMAGDCRPVAVVLAGGLSRRMGGGDKPLRTLGGRVLLDHVVERLAPQVRALALNANGDAGRFAHWGLPVLADALPGWPGPLAGVLAAMRWAASVGAEAVLTVPGDIPFLPADLAARLGAARRAAGAAVACAASRGRIHPVVALWPAALAGALEAALGAGTRRTDRWAAEQGLAVEAFAADGMDPFFNVNTPEDLAAAEAWVGA
jgi:molybdenum cofactor guanylyltransferase